MRANRDNSVYLRHIQDASEQLFEYLSDHRFADFASSEWDQAAVMRNLEIIGEAANNIEKDFQVKHANVPWKTVIGLRNVLVHDYMEVDIAVIWQIISNDLKPLYQEISKIIDTL